ncbi:MAG: sigma factor [Phycisphaeraceae bacterium]
MPKEVHHLDDSRTRLTLLWTTAQPMVMAFISSMVPNHTDAEDVLQRTAYDIATNFEQYDPDRPFIAWAIGIAKYKVLDYRRDMSRSKVVFNDAALESIADA